MSENEEITPGGIVVPRDLPSPAETQERLDAIDKTVESAQAAHALKELCTTIIKAVTECDQAFNVGRYVQSVKVISHGIGDFQLDVETKNTDVDPDEVVRAASADLQGEGGDYGKPLRNIEMGFGKHGKAD
jgi:hypothetical protein